MNEFDLIALLTRDLPSNDSVIVGAGDDCAVLTFTEECDLLFKTDAVVEGVHFISKTAPEKIGRKALARCLSDIAAMAGKPLSALITLGLPANFDVERVQQIFAGITTLAHSWEVAIVGGETTRQPQGILISIAMLGSVKKGKAILRSGAQAGDALFVTGELGGSLAGKHLDFEPRLEEAQWLAKNFQPHAMIDLSDGLAGDLRHLLTASRAGAELYAPAIPISAAARKMSRAEAAGKTPLLAALTDGEDFELLFTVPSRQAVRLADRWKEKFPKTKLSCIGKILPKPGLHLRDKDGVRTLNVHGYVHFS